MTIYAQAMELGLIISDETLETTIMDVELSYDTTDPYAATLYFPSAPSAEPGHDRPAVEWIFARDLLRDGLGMLAGEGNVYVWPKSIGQLGLSLCDDYGMARFIVSEADIRWFVSQSDTLVPAGDEGSKYADIDAELRQMIDLYMEEQS